MSSAMNYFKALRTLALRDVLTEPADYHLRFIFRWYSRNFHTPLPEVENMPQDEVLQAFYETKYEEMDEEQREAERKLLAETDVQRQERLEREDQEKSEDYQHHKWEDEEAERTRKLEEQKLKDSPPIAPMQLPGVQRLPEADLSPPSPLIKAIPPDISVKFTDVDESEFLRALEQDAMGGFDDPRDGNLPLKPPTKPEPK